MPSTRIFSLPEGHGFTGCRRTRFLSNSPQNRHPERENWGLQNQPRTRISCHAALDKAARAPFTKERRMKFAKATKFHRKSGEGAT